MGNGLADPFEFLIRTLADLYILAVMLRFLLQTVGADPSNPISQFLIKVTDPTLRPLRRIIPRAFGIDLAAIVLLLLLQMATILIIAALKGFGFSAYGLVVGSALQLTLLLLNVYFFAIIIQAILSWVAPYTTHPAALLLHSLTEPILRPVRRFVPLISGIDLSPMVVLIGILFVQRLLTALF